jgi:hypothetical protein
LTGVVGHPPLAATVVEDSAAFPPSRVEHADTPRSAMTAAVTPMSRGRIEFINGNSNRFQLQAGRWALFSESLPRPASCAACRSPPSTVKNVAAQAEREQADIPASGLHPCTESSNVFGVSNRPYEAR